MNFNNSVPLFTALVAMATMKLALNGQIKGPSGEAGWFCHQPMLEAHPAGALVVLKFGIGRFLVTTNTCFVTQYNSYPNSYLSVSLSLSLSLSLPLLLPLSLPLLGLFPTSAMSAVYEISRQSVKLQMIIRE